MLGYKVFNPDWTCRGFQYEVGKTYCMEEKPICCESGFHFCKHLLDCFNYYTFSPSNKVALVEATGDIDIQDSLKKCCTNKINIVRELSWFEVLEKVNAGKGNSGVGNSGNYNTGNYNTGNYNTSDWNTGAWNTGNKNSGVGNSGMYNTGNYNTGDWNTGDWNTGAWNAADHSTGCFNTKQTKIFMFNKLSNWTYSDWFTSAAKSVLDDFPRTSSRWVHLNNMTDEERKQHPECEVLGGFVRVSPPQQSAQMWYDNLCESYKNAIKALPNFNANIFEKITGIRVD